MGELALATDLQEKVVEKIKASFMEFIPDVAWDELVKKQVNLYIKNDLNDLIKVELTEFFKAEVRKELRKPEFLSGGWAEHGELPGEAVTQIIKELAPDLMTAIFGNVVQQAVLQIQSNMHQNTY